MGFHNTLFRNSKIISDIDAGKLNLSNELLTVRCLVFTKKNLPDGDKEQLSKIMAACQLSAQDYAVMHNGLWHQYRNLGQVREVLLFGVEEKQLGLSVNFQPNTPLVFDGRTWIKTFSIEQLSGDKNAKNILWLQALKPYFNP
ncbi:MAG: hypothetical protein QM642_08215 [Edaphocola sp.]